MIRSDSVCYFYYLFFVFVEPNLARTLHCVPPLTTQPTFTCSKLTIETLEKGVEYGQSEQ